MACAGRSGDGRRRQAAWAIGALHLDLVVGKQPCLSGYELDVLGIIKQALILVGAVFLDNLIFLCDEFRPIDRHMHRGQARIAGMGSIIDEMGRFDQVLGGQAAPVGAGAPDRAKFGHHGAFAKFGSVQRRGKGCRAAAQNHQVIPFLH